ncbi:hypothetical protein OIU76_000263 [Salix suchowensis]|nr:hypothetical protein OIU76_000263 [Salix suchowensis]
MSGGVGPTCSDIGLPNEREQEQKLQEDQSSLKNPKSSTSSKKVGFLSFPQLNSLAVMTVFAASGMVSPQDFAFVVFSIIYMYFLSKVAFPPINPPRDSLVFDPKNKILVLYVSAGAITGLFLPPRFSWKGVAFSERLSIPIRVFVPVFYNSRRIFTLVDWLRNEVTKAEQDYGGSTRRLHIGRSLAVANLAFWCFNLFGFLLPVYIPRAFKKHYTG